MPASSRHETFLNLVRDRPAFVPELLAELRVPLPRSTTARISDIALHELAPVEHFVDAVVLLARGNRPVLGVIVEAQLRRDDRKLYTWPQYVINARARHKCPFLVMVATPSPAVARWAGQQIDVGNGTVFRQHIIGPETVPKVTDAVQAAREPELAMRGLALAATSASLSASTRCARGSGSTLARTRSPATPRAPRSRPVFGLLLLLRPGGARLSGYLGAVEYIPVSTAVLVVYTYPIWVGLIARMTRGEPLSGARIVAIFLAFAGVAIALDVRASALPDARGFALAALAAAGMASMVLGSSRLVRDIDPGAVSFYLSLAATGILAVLLLVGDPHLPHTALGHLGFTGCSSRSRSLSSPCSPRSTELGRW